jgi:hypothetical protein
LEKFALTAAALDRLGEHARAWRVNIEDVLETETSVIAFGTRDATASENQSGKVFATCSINHHNDGHVAVVIPAAIGIQEMLVKKPPRKFYRPPYVGVRGCVGIELDRVSDKELSLHLLEAWRLIAPQKLQDAFVPKHES